MPHTSTSPPAIAVEGLTKRYGAVTAVDDLTFTVRPGAVTGFLNMNQALHDPARTLTRYEHPFALYCQKVLVALNEMGVADTLEQRFDERAVARARGRLDMAYGMLESQLAGNEFLAGDTFTIADCAAAPGLFYALAVHPWDEDVHPRLSRYYRALARRPSFAKVIADARPYRHLFPLAWPDDFDRHH